MDIKEFEKLQRVVEALQYQVSMLTRNVEVLKRENNRQKADIIHISQFINRMNKNG